MNRFIQLNHPGFELIDFYDITQKKNYWVLRLEQSAASLFKKQFPNPTAEQLRAIFPWNDAQMQAAGLNLNKGTAWCSFVGVDKLMHCIKPLFPNARIASDDERLPITNAERESMRRYRYLGMNVRGEPVYDRAGYNGRVIRVFDKKEQKNILIAEPKTEYTQSWRYNRYKEETDLIPLLGTFVNTMINHPSFSPRWADIESFLHQSGYKGYNDNTGDHFVQEAFEGAIVRYAILHRMRTQNKIKKTNSLFSDSFFMASINERMPRRTTRTTDTLIHQQYSTPLVLAYLSSQIIGYLPDNAVVLEPTMGHGALLAGIEGIAEKRIKAIGIELDAQRIKRATYVVPDNVRIELGNALTIPLLDTIRTDAVILNPPFGKADHETQINGVRLTRIDLQIAQRALKTLKPGGRAVLILGGDSPVHYQPGELSKSFSYFTEYLSDEYHVHGAFELDGSLYRSQGAAYPVRWITVTAKQHKDELSLTRIQQQLTVLTSWQECYTAALEMNASIERVNQPILYAALSAERWMAMNERQKKIFTIRSRSIVEYTSVPKNAENLLPKIKVGDVLVTPEDGIRSLLVPYNQDDDVSIINDHVLFNEDSIYQLPYEAHSLNGTSTTMIPRPLQQATDLALTSIESSINGSIDSWVMNELNIDNDILFRDMFMPEQVDAIALMLHQLKKGRGVINGDMTGMGKGRTLAAMFRWSLLQNQSVIFLTEKVSLFHDFWRDVIDTHALTGIEDQIEGGPLIMNSNGLIRDPISNKILYAYDQERVQSFIQNKTLPERCSIVMLTYSQLRGEYAKNRYKAIERLAFNSMIILDETHNAAGHDSQTGIFIKHLLSHCNHTVYSSATFAKRQDQMPVFFRAFPSSVTPEDINAAITASGEASLEIIANCLAKDGGMFRREHNNTALTVRINEKPTESQAQYFEQRADALAKILELVGMMCGDINASVDAENVEIINHLETLDPENNFSHKEEILSTMQPAKIQFGSTLYTISQQFYLSLKTNLMVEKAILALNEGRKPIIFFESTMEAAIRASMNLFNDPSTETDTLDKDLEKDLEASMNRELSADLDQILDTENTSEKTKKNIVLKNSFQLAIHRMALRMTKVTYRNQRGIKRQESRAHMEPYCTYLRTIDTILRQEFPDDIPLSVIDTIKFRIQRAGYSCGEITGRSLALELDDDGRNGLVVQRKKTLVYDECRSFNFANTDALILGIAGNSGISLHASLHFVNQQQRELIVGQIPSDINVYMQAMGRVNRAGQVIAPIITNISTYLPGEYRIISAANRKLGLSSGLTKGNRDDTSIQKQIPDVINVLGNRAAMRLALERLDLFSRMGLDEEVYKKKLEETSKKASGTELVSLLTGRFQMLSVSLQKDLWATLEMYFTEQVLEHEARGNNPLRTLDLHWNSAQVLETDVYIEGDYSSAFDEDCVLKKIEHCVKYPVWSWEQHLETIIKSEASFKNHEWPVEQRGFDLKQMINKRIEAEIPVLIFDKKDYILDLLSRLGSVYEQMEDEELWLKLIPEEHPSHDGLMKSLNRARDIYNKFNDSAKSMLRFQPGLFYKVQHQEFLLNADGEMIESKCDPYPVLIQSVYPKRSLYLSDWQIAVVSPHSAHSEKMSLFRFLQQYNASLMPSIHARVNPPASFVKECNDLHKSGINEMKTEYILTGNLFRAAASVKNVGQIARLDGEQVFLLPKGFHSVPQFINIQGSIKIEPIVHILLDKNWINENVEMMRPIYHASDEKSRWCFLRTFNGGRVTMHGVRLMVSFRSKDFSIGLLVDQNKADDGSEPEIHCEITDGLKPVLKNETLNALMSRKLKQFSRSTPFYGAFEQRHLMDFFVALEQITDISVRLSYSKNNGGVLLQNIRKSIASTIIDSEENNNKKSEKNDEHVHHNKVKYNELKSGARF